MAKVVRMTEGFQLSFPDEEQWVNMNGNNFYVRKALRDCFVHLLLGEKNGISETVQIFRTGIGFRVERAGDSSDFAEDLKVILREAAEKCTDEDARKYLKKLAEPRRKLIANAWRSAQTAVDIPPEAEALLNNLASQIAEYVKNVSPREEEATDELLSNVTDAVASYAQREAEEKPLISEVQEILKQSTEQEKKLMAEYVQTHGQIRGKEGAQAYEEWKEKREVEERSKTIAGAQEILRQEREKEEEKMKEYIQIYGPIKSAEGVRAYVEWREKQRAAEKNANTEDDNPTEDEDAVFERMMRAGTEALKNA